MKIILSQRHLFNRCKPMIQIGVGEDWGSSDEWVQWDECDLTGLPPEREGGSMTDHGKIPKGQWDNLPKMFRATDGKEYPIEGIVMLG